ncbi:MAG: hypothetical protein A2W03_06250 [Candidatus Aminicenantes bacterium RBG_16_63_16]|nr:MAG: hypothetical protein A2W03_06250 [Candidatus Aminicenantes bacterium RBG_16_63_16]
MRVYKIAESGREITLYEIFPGETCILNAACILSHKNYPANATALTSGWMVHLPGSVFLELIEDFAEMRAFVFSLFSQRLAEIMELVEEVTFRRQDERLVEYIIKKSSDNELHTTHQAIANDLGTSREVVSRILKSLEQQKKIVLSRSLIRLVKL